MINLRRRWEELPFSAQQQIATDMKLEPLKEGEATFETSTRWRREIRKQNRVAEADLRMREKKREIRKAAGL